MLKINSLLKIWPKGTLAVLPWLEVHGISRQLADSYCQSKWLFRVDRGLYQQSDDSIGWIGVVYTLQKELGLKVHVAAKSALELAGMGHYLPLGGGSNMLFLAQGQRLPRWFKRHYQRQVCLYALKPLFSSWDLGLHDKDLGNFSIFISSPERAILECLHLVPKTLSLTLAAELMEKLRTLRPNLLQALLESCRSIKVKRLFLYFAETQQQPWFKRIDLTRIQLGKGKRVIDGGGKYIAKYQISVPDLNRHEGLIENAPF